MDTNRKTAFYILRDVEKKKAYSNISTNIHITRQNPPSPAFVRELAFGVLRRKIYLDHVIGLFVRTPIAKMGAEELTILRMGLYQILCMNSVPEYAAVNESVFLARMFARGRDGFVNGVLRQYLRDKEHVDLPPREDDPVRYLSLRYSYEPWIVKLWIDEYGESKAERLLAAGDDVPPLTIRVNTLKTDRGNLKKRMIERGFNVYDGRMFKNALLVEGAEVIAGRFYNSGLYSIQDEGAMAPVFALDPKPGETVVDVCAAPGGKTTAMAELMKNNGEIYAMDIYKRRARIINAQAKRLGIGIINTMIWDASNVRKDLIDRADKVLCDVPCSGLGTVRHKPEIKYKQWDSELEALPVKQRDILAASSRYVKPGGVIVYCTCTISKKENEAITGDFLKKNSDFIKLEQKQLTTADDGTDGFYICKMLRREK
ncbi:MAG: 16S rRNA (cytosine(967)-C(5))-methyltransferase RsmB [Clostridiales Family XIII bacterium]|jgi:16S rRNA (cytosine967-C5)-methyltransferase|nr:16S rRNA (cytosine(967)-C(5))-methyltransferase RsmB [Clostridiales Family XIII bacterium]